jgi:Uma2 family endonuclease
MPTTLQKPPPAMTVADFLDWPGDGSGRKFQLVDGEVRAMPVGSVARGLIHTDLICLVANHLMAVGSPYHVLCRPPVVPRVRASDNLRLPALAVSAAPDRPDDYAVTDPILLIEILSPGNAADTWENVWSYCTIPSVREIAVVHSTRVMVELLRRGSDGHWPEQPEQIGPGGTLRFESIGFACPLSDVYAQTHLASGNSS